MKNMYAIRRQGASSIFVLFSIFLTVVAELLAILSSRANPTYEIESLEAVMICSEVAVLLLCIVFFFSFYLTGNKSMLLLDFLRLAAVVLLCVCFYLVLTERAKLMGYVWFSDLESGNANSVTALNEGVASCVFYVVSLLCLAVSGLFELVNAKKLRRSRARIKAEIAALEEELKALES